MKTKQHLTILAIIGCGLLAGRKPEVLNPTPTSNFYIRTAFDKDPSIFLGRFVAEDALVIDESAARKTECSKYISYTIVDAGNVDYDEVMNASSTVALGLKIPGTQLSSNVGAGGGMGIRASYTMTSKMIADITDPVAFDACCRKTDGNCSTRFIGEFIAGTGKLWSAHSEYAGLKKLGKLQKANPFELEASGDFNWSKSRSFNNPVYFAFKITDVPRTDCKAMIDNPPESTDGIYFGGVSLQRPDEVSAKKFAMLNAQQQIVRYIATSLVEESEISIKYNGGSQALIDDEEFIRTQSEGVASFVKADMFCPLEEVVTPDGPVYVSRVLAYISNDSLDTMSQQLLKSLPELP